MTLIETVPLLDETGARRLTQSIQLLLDSAKSTLDRLESQVFEAYERRADLALGYASWSEYADAEFHDNTRYLPRGDRREFTIKLAERGLPSRAIAPIIGVTDRQVRHDIAKVGSDFPPAVATPEPAVIVNKSTGEVIDEAPVTVTESHTTKVVHGLDGKSYPVAPPKPKPADDDAANRQNAETASKEIAQAIDVMWRFGHVAHRTRILTDWWPLGKGAVAPASRGLFNPGQLRQIAGSLEQLATEMEQLDV